MEPKPLPFNKELVGISKKTLEIHHDKLYVGYVKKADEISSKLRQLSIDIISGKAEGGNATYSELRALKQAETFAVDAVLLHEWYFENLGGDGDPTTAPELSKTITEKWGSITGFIKYFSECAMVARGWSILCWNPSRQKLNQFNCDVHDQGGVWGCIPIIVLDVYEHAYFIDFGSDRKSYIEAFWKNFDWVAAENKFKEIVK